MTAYHTVSYDAVALVARISPIDILVRKKLEAFLEQEESRTTSVRTAPIEDEGSHNGQVDSEARDRVTVLR